MLIVEGEKDADALAELGYPATTSPMGAGKWKDSYADVFAGGEVVILPQRGIGSPSVAMPMHWLRDVSKLGRIRRHPGRHVGPPLEDDLRNARAVVTWGSGAAVRPSAVMPPIV